MKKTFCIILLAAAFLPTRAQHQINSFFDDMGIVALETQELKNDTVVSVFHRREDVVWSRIVYSIIDMRYKQNFEMYYPTNFEDPKFKSLFGVIIDAIANGDGAGKYLQVYPKPMNTDLKPRFNQDPSPRSQIQGFLELAQDEDAGGAGFDFGAMQGAEGMEDIDMSVINAAASVVNYDSAANVMTVSEYYDQFVRNQYKFLVQEVIFFDKHYSRLYRQIMAVAPLYAPLGKDEDPYECLFQQITFWIPFRDLRPYLAHQYMIASRNSSKRITYDEFFAKRLYTSYLVGEENIYDRVIPEYLKTEKDIKQEQARIETELLNFEQDLWEY